MGGSGLGSAEATEIVLWSVSRGRWACAPWGCLVSYAGFCGSPSGKVNLRTFCPRPWLLYADGNKRKSRKAIFAFVLGFLLPEPFTIIR